MAEKIISCKEGKVIEKDGKDWVELIDQEDKTHRVFRSIQNNDGVWVHLDKEVDMLKGKIEDGSINGLALKLTKEKKGTFWNVTGVKEVKDVFVREAQKQVMDTREESIEAQVAFKGLIELCVADRVKVNNPVIQTAIAWALTRLGGKNESAKVPTEETRQLSGKEAGTDNNRGGKTPVKDAKTLMEWALSHGKEYHNSWVRKEANLGDAVITEAMAIKAYQDICAVQGWT